MKTSVTNWPTHSSFLSFNVYPLSQVQVYDPGGLNPSQTPCFLQPSPITPAHSSMSSQNTPNDYFDTTAHKYWLVPRATLNNDAPRCAMLPEGHYFSMVPSAPVNICIFCTSRDTCWTNQDRLIQLVIEQYIIIVSHFYSIAFLTMFGVNLSAFDVCKSKLHLNTLQIETVGTTVPGNKIWHCTWR